MKNPNRPRLGTKRSAVTNGSVSVLCTRDHFPHNCIHPSEQKFNPRPTSALRPLTWVTLLARLGLVSFLASIFIFYGPLPNSFFTALRSASISLRFEVSACTAEGHKEVRDEASHEQGYFNRWNSRRLLMSAAGTLLK